MVRDYKGPKCTILVDQGADDNFLKSNQLCPENLVQAAKENESLVAVSLRMQEVITFIPSLSFQETILFVFYLIF